MPVGVVEHDRSRASADPQIRHRGMVLGLKRDSAETRVMGDPVHFTEGRRKSHDYPPTLGENTEEVLSGLLGLSDDEVGRLVEAGAIATGKG